MDNLLYFPYISIQKMPWLFKSLLYWDSIDTITPTEMLDKPHKMDNHMRKLMEAELVKPVFPGDYIYEFKENFIDIIDQKYMGIETNQNNKTQQNAQERIKYGTFIHMEKISNIGDQLIERGLAEQRGSWFLVNRSIARDYMIFLASEISKVTGHQLITDSKVHINKKTITLDSNRYMLEKNNTRMAILKNLFPVPCEISRFEDLYYFKEKYHAQLKSFRTRVESVTLNVLAFPEELREEKLDLVITELEEEKRQIAEKIQDKWGSIFNTGSLLTIGSGVMTTSNEWSNNDLTSKIALGLAISGGVVTTMRDMNKLKEENLNNPLIYAFLVEKEIERNKTSGIEVSKWNY